MRVDVLNGVNFDVLDRRDPAIYGGLSLHELEQRIEAWAGELGHTVRCRQTNSEGEYVEVLPRLARLGRGRDRQPGRVEPLQLRDPRRARALRRADRRGAPLEPGGARRGVAAHLRDRAARGEADPRPRPRRATARRSSSSAARVNGRVDRLRERLEEPLLVSNPANVRYLSGLASSNAALLVEPERVRALHRLPLRGDGPRDRGRRVRRREARPLPDAVRAARPGRSASRRPSLSFERYSRLHAGGIEPVPRYGLVEELRAVKDEDELDAIRRAARSRTPRSSASRTRATSSAAPSASSPGASSSSCTRRTPRASRSP